MDLFGEVDEGSGSPIHLMLSMGGAGLPKVMQWLLKTAIPVAVSVFTGVLRRNNQCSFFFQNRSSALSRLVCVGRVVLARVF
jgi:hypothetical protein